MNKQRILIVDDSSFVRRMLQDWASAEPDLEVVGVAKNGQEGIDLARSLKPDIVTLDVEMPVMTGLEALPEILKTGARVLMVSSVTLQGARCTLQALDAGAYDFVTKPTGASSLKFVEAKSEILDKIRAARYARAQAKPSAVIRAPQVKRTSDKLVVVASSTGGPRTLRTFFDGLPQGFPCPILIVQHMPPGFTQSLAFRLNEVGTVPCKEAEDGELVCPGQAYIAPGGKHMSIDQSGHIRLDDDPNIHGVKPAAEKLFLSAAQHYGRKVIGLVLTGMGKDGADGAVAIRKAGGQVFGESEASCVIYGMPKAAKQAGGIDAEFKIEEIPAALVGALSGGVARAS